MKNKYNVTIEETVSKTFEVIADDEKQAKEIVESYAQIKRLQTNNL